MQQLVKTEPVRIESPVSTSQAMDRPEFHAALLQACEKLAVPFAILGEDSGIVFANGAFLASRMDTAKKGPATLGRSSDLAAEDDGRGEAFDRQALSGGYTLLSCRRGRTFVTDPASGARERRDALTGLPNRLLLHERLIDAVNSRDPDEGFALLLLDLDRFKTVNDTLGHPVGDKLLCRVVDRIGKVIRNGDLLVRLGGDEFAILQKSPKQPDAARALAHRLVDLVSRSYVIDEHLVNVGLSVGIALLPSDGPEPERLIKNADLALYSAKDDGRGRFRLFEQAMDARVQARRSTEIDLRKALALRQFELHYQPQFNLLNGGVGGFEALIRWRHPAQGLVSPATFIPIAEETGLIVQIGAWVLRAACEEAMRWPEPLRVAVNLSPVQFQRPGLVATVASALASSGLPAARLELEITETLLLQDTTGTLATLHQLKGLGVQIAMDDFGTGYSSLNHLRAFPFDKVKIDPSFINEMRSDTGSAAIVRAVVGLGISLGISTTAEGVETAEQLEHLRAEGCSDIQGYLISKPIPASDIAELLREHGRGGSRPSG